MAETQIQFGFGSKKKKSSAESEESFQKLNDCEEILLLQDLGAAKEAFAILKNHLKVELAIYRRPIIDVVIGRFS